MSASCFEKNRVLNAISFRISFKAFHMAEIFQRRTSFLAPARIIKFLLLSPPINLSVSWGWRCSGPVNIFLGVKPDNCKYLLQAGSKRQYHNNNCHLSWRVIDSMMFPYRRLSLMASQHIITGQLGNLRLWWAQYWVESWQANTQPRTGQSPVSQSSAVNTKHSNHPLC